VTTGKKKFVTIERNWETKPFKSMDQTAKPQDDRMDSTDKVAIQ
jgi:hypothetical protein